MFIKRKNRRKYRLFHSNEEIDNWAEMYYGEWSRAYKKSMCICKEFSKETLMSNVIECYCGNDYRGINQYLRTGIDNTGNFLYRELSNILLIIIALAPRVPENIVVFRAVKEEFISELLINHKNGCPTCEKGFISTSLSKNILDSSAPYTDTDYILKIYVPCNAPGIYVTDVVGGYEQELLLFPNGFFKLLKTPSIFSVNPKVYECELFYCQGYML